MFRRVKILDVENCTWNTSWSIDHKLFNFAKSKLDTKVQGKSTFNEECHLHLLWL